jgi:hypothetical protein
MTLNKEESSQNFQHPTPQKIKMALDWGSNSCHAGSILIIYFLKGTAF